MFGLAYVLALITLPEILVIDAQNLAHDGRASGHKGSAFLGELGLFKEMPKKSEMTDSDYESIQNKTYFFKNS